MTGSRRMVSAIALCLAATAAMACNERGADDDDVQGDTTMTSADTTVTQRTVEDTLIVRRDTAITTDTVRRAGGVVDSSRPRRP